MRRGIAPAMALAAIGLFALAFGRRDAVLAGDAPGSMDSQIQDLGKQIRALEQLVKSLGDERDERHEADQAEIAFLERQSPPIGTVVAFGGDWTTEMESRTGWMLCDGRELDPNADGGQFRDLHAAIGHAHGWNARTGKFRIPDYRGVFLRGVNGGRTDKYGDLEADTRLGVATGGNKGNAVGSIQKYATALPAESFKTDDPGDHVHATPRLTNNFSKGLAAASTPSTSPPAYDSFSTAPAGKHTHLVASGGDKETRPNNCYVNWLIKFRAGPAPR